MNLPTQRYSQDLRKYYRLPSVQVSLTVVLAMFVITIFVAFALRPTIISIVTLKKTIVESKKTLQQLDGKVVGLQKAAAQLEAVKPFLETLNASIPNKGAAYTPLTLALESLAGQSGVKLESESLGATLLFSRIFSPFTPGKYQSVVSLPFSIRATGSYSDISIYLSKLLSMERVLMVESITITKEVGGKDNSRDTGGTVALNISGNTYYLADEAQLQKAIADAKGKK